MPSFSHAKSLLRFLDITGAAVTSSSSDLFLRLSGVPIAEMSEYLKKNYINCKHKSNNNQQFKTVWYRHVSVKQNCFEIVVC